MINRTAIQQWSEHAPWIDNAQIEQDLNFVSQNNLISGLCLLEAIKGMRKMFILVYTC